FLDQLGPQSLRETGQGVLAGDVGQQVRDGDLAADGGNVDDAPLAAAAHAGQGGQGGVQGRPEVGLHARLVIGDGHYFHRADLDDAGVVDQHVDAAQPVIHGPDHVLDLPPIGQIASDRNNA